MKNDPVLALIEKWEADARRQDWPANGEFLTPQECAKQIRAILPQRDQVVAETVERCATEFESDAWVDATGHQVANRIRKLSPDPLFRHLIENAARLEEAKRWREKQLVYRDSWGEERIAQLEAEATNWRKEWESEQSVTWKTMRLPNRHGVLWA